MLEAVCKATVHKRGGAKNLPYILRDEAAKDPAAQSIEGMETHSSHELTPQGQVIERALEYTHQLELAFNVGLPLVEGTDLTLDDDPVFTCNVPEFVTGDPYGKEWIEEEKKREGKGDQEKGRFRGEDIGAGKQKRNELTLEDKRLNAEIHFGLRADYEENKGGVSHYRIVITHNAIITNKQFKSVILPFLYIVFTINEVLISLHSNTGDGKTHAHLQINSRQVDGRRINLGQLYFKLDEIWVKTCAEHFHDRGIYDRHMKKKEETRKWKEACKIAKESNGILPLKPDREADHHGTKYKRAYDDNWVGRQIAKEKLAQKKVEFLTVTKAPKKEIRAVREEAAKQTELVNQALKKRKEGKKGTKDYVPPTLRTVKEGKEFATYEQAIKATHTKEMASHLMKVSEVYLKSLGEKDLIIAAVDPIAGEAHVAKILQLRLEVLKEHKLGIDRTDWTEETLKADAVERLDEIVRKTIVGSEEIRTMNTGATSKEAPSQQPDLTADRSPKEIKKSAQSFKPRMVMAGANELIEKHVLERSANGQKFGALQKGHQKFEYLIFDMKKIVFDHCLEKRSSLEELKLTERELTETLEKYVFNWGKGQVSLPLGSGERLKEVVLAEKKHRASMPLTLEHGHSHTRELSETIMLEQTSREKACVPNRVPLSDLENAQLYGRAILAGLRLDGSKFEAIRYKNYSLLEEKIIVPDRNGELMTWSLAQGKYFGATPRNALREKYWASAPQINEAVNAAEKRIEEGQKLWAEAVRETGSEFDRLSSELVEVVKVRASHGHKTPAPNFTTEQSPEVEQLLYMTWNTDALEKLSRDEEAHNLRGRRNVPALAQHLL
jgi:hypothetical protein